MMLSKVFTAAVLTLAAASSFADNGGGPLDLSTGSAGFNRTPIGAGAFVDTYTFTLAGTSYLTSGQVGATQLGDQDVDFSSIVVKQGAATVASFSQLGFDPQEFWALNPTLLAAGAYSLVLTGTQSTGGGSYSGNLVIAAAAVPEPETYAMLLAGLGVLGFVARRRKAN